MPVNDMNCNGTIGETGKFVTTFAAGPTKLPNEVKEKIVSEFFNFNGSQLGILETMHRSKDFMELLNLCQRNLCNVLNIPKNYRILFLQGGASGQFAGVPMNLLGGESRKADYLVTGIWSAKALEEAKKYGDIREVCPRIPTYCDLPDEDNMIFDKEAAYFYYCDNDTIAGLEFKNPPTPPSGIPIVCDMSSNLLSKPVDIKKYGVIFAGTQKNFGCSGCTIVIIRDDLLDRALPITPLILNYGEQVKANSMVNTPPTFAIYVANVMSEWILKEGGLGTMQERCCQRAKIIYSVVESSKGFYRIHPAKSVRSRVNIVLNLEKRELEELWLQEAAKCGLLNLRGHRSVGGLRISMYNAITLQEVHRLAEFMQDFQEHH